MGRWSRMLFDIPQDVCMPHEPEVAVLSAFGLHVLRSALVVPISNVPDSV